MYSVASAWHEAQGRLFSCSSMDWEPLPRCAICGWLFTPFDAWQDQIHVFDELVGTIYSVCPHHPEIGEEGKGIWDCTRATFHPALPTHSRLRILAHEGVYWLRVLGRFVWIQASWVVRLLYVRIFYPAKYRAYRAFMRGELFKESK